MRGLYGTIKAVTFAWVLLLQPLPSLVPEFWADWSEPCETITVILVLTSVGLCLLRGFPVIIEFVVEQKIFAGESGARESH